MRRRRKNTKLLLVLLILGISIGFALLSQTLNINGIAGINKNTWDIHWDNTSVVVSPNSVQSETPIVKGTNDNTVEFSTELELPGDYFEFTVDAINEGTVDGIITITSSKTYEMIGGEEQEIQLPDYIKYTVTYDEGGTPTIGDILAKGTSKKYKVRVEFDENATDLPNEVKEYKYKYSVTYEQYKEDPTKPYTVTFNPNGGTVSPTTKNVVKGEKIGELPIPTKNEIPFLGWYTGLTDGTRITSNTIPSGNVTYYAHWAENATTFDTGQRVNEKFKILAGDQMQSTNPYMTVDNNITSIVRSEELPENENEHVEIVSEEGQPEIYAWFDNGTIKWWTEASTVYLNANASYMFNNLKALTNIDTSFYTNNTINMSSMFAASVIENLDLNSFDTSSVTDMNTMFASTTITDLNIKNFDTSNVTNMAAMFASANITSVDFTNFDTSNVTNISSMFAGTKIPEIDLSNFDVSKVTGFSGVFSGTTATTVNLSNWSIVATTYLSSMFSGSQIENIILENFDTSRVTSMYQMFAGCTKLKSLDLTSFDTRQVTDMGSMFAGASNIETITVSDNFKTSKVTSSNAMFGGCVKLVGGLGTVYDETHIDKLYARYDKAELKPGYFNAGDVTYHTVTFNPNGGDVDPTTIQVIEGGKIKNLPTATRDGMNFRGWFTEINGGTQVTSNTKITEDVTLYAHWYSNVNVIYDANTGKFDNDETTRTIKYEYGSAPVTKYSHTPNINDSGVANSEYASNLAINDVVTIAGSSQLTIEVWYSTESASYDWLAIYPEGITPDQNNYASATISGGKLAGHGNYSGYTKPNDSDTMYHQTFTVDGDTAQFFFRSDGSSNYYGYYAIITGTGKGYSGDKTYQEPTKENNRFKGWNTAQDGSGKTFTTEKEITSYIDNSNNNMNLYAQWEETVTVTFNGNGGSVQANTTRVIKKGEPIGSLPNATKSNNALTGWHTGETDGIKVSKDYVPTTNITVWAHWAELEAVFDTGKTVNTKFKTLAGDTSPGYGSNNTTITAVRRSTTEPTEENKTDEHVVSYAGSKLPIYAWFDDGTIYWWSAADKEYTFYDAQYMFASLNNLTEIDTSFDTSISQTIGYMFYNDYSLTSIDVSGFNTSNVSDMGYTFSGCNGLTALDLSNWDTRNTANMNSMLSGTSNLATLNMSNWDFTRYAPTSGYLMPSISSYGLNGLKTLILDNTKYPSNMYYGLYNMSNVETISLRNVDTSNVTNMSYMFSNLSKLKTLDLSDFDTSNVTNMSYMFYYCQDLSSIDLSNFDTHNVTTLYEMFYYCNNLVKIDASSFNTSKVKSFDYVFGYMNKLEELDISNWDFSNYGSTSLMSNIASSTYSRIKKLKMDNVIFPSSMSYALANMSNLEEISLKNVDTSNVTSMGSVFYSDSKITELSLGAFDTRKVTDMGSMFGYMTELRAIYVSDNFDTDLVSYSSSMFYNDEKLEGGLGTKYDKDHTDKEYAHYDRGEHDPGYFDKDTPVRLITLDPNSDALDIEIIRTREGKEINIPKPVWKDHVFLGWYTSLLPDGVKVENPYTVSEDVTLYAKWRDAVYLTITFNPNGGTVEETSRQVLENNTIGQLPVPTKGDEMFLGWYTDPNVGTMVSKDKVPTENMTLYAHWDQCKDFSTASWETIKNNVNNNLSYYPIGCKKQIDMGTYGTHTVRVSNNTLPSECNKDNFSQSTCGFVLEFDDVITKHRMNPWDSNISSRNGNGNVGGWQYSEMRELVNNDIFNSLPSDLRSLIVPTKVISSHGPVDSSNFTTKDKMYLLSTREIWNGAGRGVSIETFDTAFNNTRQLDYYRIKDVIPTYGSNYEDVNIEKKYNGEKSEWWLRTTGPDNTVTNAKNFIFFYVYEDMMNWLETNIESGVSPMFRIANSYRVTFDANGGTVDPTFKEIARGETVDELPEPTYEENGFAGWYTLPIGGIKVDENYKPTGNVTLYAHWIPDRTITFNSGIGTFENNETTNSITYKHSEKEIIKYSHTPNLNNNGEKIGDLGLYDKNDFVTIEGATSLEIDVTYATGATGNFLAVFPREIAAKERNAGLATKKIFGRNIYDNYKTYNTTFTINGDTAQFYYLSKITDDHYGYIATIRGVNSSEIGSRKYQEPTKEGYRFVEWNTKADGSGDSYTTATAVLNDMSKLEGKTLYAQMEENDIYTITLNPNGGEVDPTSVQVEEGDAIGSLPEATKGEYTFKGWWTNLTDGINISSQVTKYVPTGNMTLTAKWFGGTVTFDTNGGQFEDGETTKSYRIVENQRIYQYYNSGIKLDQYNTCYRSWWFECDATAVHDSTKYYKDHPLLYFADHNPSVYNKYGYNEADIFRFYLNNVDDPSWDITPEPYEDKNPTNYGDSDRLTTDVHLCRGYSPIYIYVMYMKNLHTFTPTGGGNTGWEKFVVGATNNHLTNRHTVRQGYVQTGWSEEPYTYKTQGELGLEEPISDEWIIDRGMNEYGTCQSYDVYATWR